MFRRGELFFFALDALWLNGEDLRRKPHWMKIKTQAEGWDELFRGIAHSTRQSNSLKTCPCPQRFSTTQFLSFRNLKTGEICMARYLVTGEYIDPGPMQPPQQLAQMIEKLVLPSFEALAKLEEQRKVLGGGIMAGARAGAFIVDVASNTELNQLLQELPFWGICKWTATPLQTFRDRAADEKKAVDRMKASL
jgi:hypothetical protein